MTKYVVSYSGGSGGIAATSSYLGTLQHQLPSTCRASVMSRTSRSGSRRETASGSRAENGATMTLQRSPGSQNTGNAIASLHRSTQTLQRGVSSASRQQHIQQIGNSYDQPANMLTLDGRRLHQHSSDFSDHSKDELRDVTSL